MKDNVSSDNFEALYSGRFADGKKDENGDKTDLNTSKVSEEEIDNIALRNNYLNQNTGDKSPNFQNVGSDESVRADLSKSDEVTDYNQYSSDLPIHENNL